MKANEEHLQKMRNYFQKHKADFAHYNAEQRDRLKLEMITAYGGKCKRCGIDDTDVLVLDHIDDDARIEKDLFGLNARGGHKHYGRLKKQGWPQERFQLLCANCNMKKENERRRAGIYERWGEKQEYDRSASHANVPPPAHNRSGIKGVFWNTQKQRWQARIMVDYQTTHLGFYLTIREAANAYARKAKEVWGDMAQVASEEEIQAAENKPRTSKIDSTELSLSDLGL